MRVIKFRKRRKKHGNVWKTKKRGFERQNRSNPHKQRLCGALGGTRTHDPLIRSQVLYPAELRAHFLSNFCLTSAFIYYHTDFSLSIDIRQFFPFSAKNASCQGSRASFRTKVEAARESSGQPAEKQLYKNGRMPTDSSSSSAIIRLAIPVEASSAA